MTRRMFSSASSDECVRRRRLRVVEQQRAGSSTPCPFRRASRRSAYGAAAISASSAPAACGSRDAAAGAGCGSNWRASSNWRPAYCPRRRAADSARAAPRNAPAPALRSRAASRQTSPDMRSHLRSPAGDELVEDDLRAIGEIAELRFPQHQRVGIGERIAIFEAEHRLLGQHRIDDLEAALAVGEGDRAARNALRSPDRSARCGAARRCRARCPVPRGAHRSLLEQRAEGERFGRRPVDPLPGFDRRCGARRGSAGSCGERGNPSGPR